MRQSGILLLIYCPFFIFPILRLSQRKSEACGMTYPLCELRGLVALAQSNPLAHKDSSCLRALYMLGNHALHITPSASYPS